MGIFKNKTFMRILKPIMIDSIFGMRSRITIMLKNYALNFVGNRYVYFAQKHIGLRRFYIKPYKTKLRIKPGKMER